MPRQTVEVFPTRHDDASLYHQQAIYLKIVMRVIMRFMLALLSTSSYLITLPSSSSAEETAPPALRSPTKEYSVRILHAPLLGSDELNDYTLCIYHKSHCLTKFQTYGYLIKVIWSSNGKFVAVNNRRADSGDYLWVFRLADGHLIRRPIDATSDNPDGAYEKYVQLVTDSVTRVFPDLTIDNFARLFTIAEKWTIRNELKVSVEVDFRNSDDYYAVIHNTYCIKGDRLVLRSQVIKKEHSLE